MPSSSNSSVKSKHMLHTGLTQQSYCCLTLYKTGGMWWCSWLRYCTTSQKVAGSIPNGVTGIFHWLNPSNRTIALGSTQSLTEMRTRGISWGGGGSKGGRCVGLTTLPPPCADYLEILGASTSCSPKSLYRDRFYILQNHHFNKYCTFFKALHFKVHFINGFSYLCKHISLCIHTREKYLE
jgi:hypothetical protein